ncbi:ABC-2 type transport system ATP-binding protein [Chitinivorax tropicus]|uniref:ABC-2 type transport system ATP-binding protein n=1 Tax=Chitinivorax tropicus TaxID=714531 RepID=A0A840MBR7_9PROT|nr:ATP-binding cassette domain-containing protein [Chitinivorax tropicus]MBB5016774.1 ABC-2 type transport system ATP-binding protein [Chitinivorax tropicus]
MAASEVVAPVIHAQGFTKRYRQHIAVSGLDLTVQPGEIFGLIGPDGAGKSSFMKAVAGVLGYDAGELTVFGTRLDSETAAERIKDRIGLMPQGLGQNLYAELSIEENIDFFAKLRLVPDDILAERKARLLKMTRLEAFRHRAMKNLSGGMKQKLGLVCTLIHEPRLIILDEPTTGVDPVSRRDFWAILGELLQAQGMTALVSTAYMDEAARFHRMALLYEGKVLAQGTPEDILDLAPGSIVTVTAQPQFDAWQALRGPHPQIEAQGPQLRLFTEGLRTADAAAQVRDHLQGVQILQLDATEPELEDVFVALLRQRGLSEQRTQDFVSPVGDRSPQTTAAIEAQQLTRVFGEFTACDQVSFRVPPGEIFGLLGANGAGKTTVIKMLTGILPPSAGKGQVAGADMRTAGRQIKERIGYMSQAFSLYMDLTVLENIALYAGIYGLDRRQTATRSGWIIDMAGLRGHERDLAATLPMGLRQRLALGCALVHQPQVLFLDEPTSGVDPIGRRQFWDILFHLSRVEQVAILITTHYMSEAEHCDHLALMFAGRVVADATPAALKQALRDKVGTLLEATVSQPQAALGLLQAQGFVDASLYGKKIHLFSPTPDAAIAQIRPIWQAAGIHCERIDSRPISMEDVFVQRVTELERMR